MNKRIYKKYLKRKIIESCISKHKEIVSERGSLLSNINLFGDLFSSRPYRLKMLIDEYNRKYNRIVVGKTKKGYVIISEREHIMRYFNRSQIASQMFMSVCYGNITDPKNSSDEYTDDNINAAIYEKYLKINIIDELLYD